MKLKAVYGSQNLGPYCINRRLATPIAKSASPNAKSPFMSELYLQMFHSQLGYCSNSYVHLDGCWIKLNSSIDSVTSHCGEKPALLGGYTSSFWSLKSLHHIKTLYVNTAKPFYFGHYIAFSYSYGCNVNCIRSTHRSPQGLWSTKLILMRLFKYSHPLGEFTRSVTSLIRSAASWMLSSIMGHTRGV
ncbi:LOW QUALITY PROTEIN: hypothetical protein Cgig2_025796 [Carnegiea gigantea]|uniref:Uncharacterized protein n=1 Tax=Carnegiea gigantea TaxID=171969 RepID=A0A9Q1QH48_9CARY|nr:LOW QUALITY PROTEIN: hypothetical protein Cgig2_025796 [Carnegiea gigantea]